MRKVFKWSAVALVAIAAAIQFVRPAHTNPPVDPARTIAATLDTHPAAVAVLNRACIDCHSNETVWPWYSHVAPVAWIVTNHVNEGREKVNLSEWQAYPPEKQRKLLHEMCEEVSEGGMPMWSYTIVHPTAALSGADVAAICRASDAASRALLVSER